MKTATTCIGTCRKCGKTTRYEARALGGNFVFAFEGKDQLDARPLRQCACGAWMSGKAILATHKAGVRCDARCTGAKGHDCTCSCGGKNHGSNH